jgi:hypothetical protein
MHFFLFTKRPVAVGVAGGHDVLCSYILWMLAILLNPFCNLFCMFSISSLVMSH